MNNLKRILSMTLGGIILIGTTSLGAKGIVNAPNGLILRKEAKSGDNIIMTISDNSKVEILEKDGEWYKVKYNSYEGYLFAEYVEVEETIEDEKEETVEEETEKEEQDKEPEVENKENVEKQYPQNQKAKSDLKIYIIPSVTAKTIATVKENKEFTINYELNNWVNITYGKTTGWIRKYFIEDKDVIVEKEDVEEEQEVEDKKPEEDKKEESKKDNETESTQTIIDNKKGYVDVSNSANIREKASTDSKIINTLLRNTEIIIIAEEGDFYKIKYQDITGYIAKSLVSDKPVEDVTSRGNSGERENKPENNIEKEDKPENKIDKEENKEPQKETTNANSSKGKKIVEFAKKYVGYNYVSGGSTPKTGFDCSGLTYYVYNSFGYSMGRTCTAQAKMGKPVSRENLSAGDLIFFCNGGNGSIGHVGIYIGGGQFVHAANSRKGVRIDTINEGYYNKYYYTARRLID